MMWLLAIVGAALGQDVAPVVQTTESALDMGTIGGGAGGLGAIVGIVLTLERVGLISIPSRSAKPEAPKVAPLAVPQPDPVSHTTPCSDLRSLGVREQERHDAHTRELQQLRAGIDRIGDRLDAIADRIPRSGSSE